MQHIIHIKNNKKHLDLRWRIIRAIREFFWEKEFIEVETPHILVLPGQEPYLSPMRVPVSNERGEVTESYLHTSPEYTMKKMLAAGYENIFSLSKCFRDYESFGGNHNPEFTMVEWYRTGVDFYTIMQDLEDLFSYVTECLGEDILSPFETPSFIRYHMRDLWKETINVDLNEYLSTERMYTLCVERGYSPAENERYEDLFYRIFLNEIEPKLEQMGGVILHHYPAQMAALSELSKEDPRYAERFEVYIGGIELANAFSDLTDVDEQRKRLEEERALRKKLGKDVYDIDEEFLYAVKHLPTCSGIALGVDRFVQILLGCDNIDDVLPLPMSKMI